MEVVCETVISTLVERLVDYALSVSQTLLNCCNDGRTTAEEITKWYTIFRDLDGILQDAEEKQTGNCIISRWLADLTDLAYEIEDILEEIEYESKLAQKQKENTSRWNLLATLKRKRSKVPDKLKEITVRLKKINKRKKMLNLVTGNPSVPKVRRTRALESYTSIEPNIFGRQREKEKIVELLLEPNNASERLGIIPIVGMGGIGKTTLAQNVFIDDRVVGCFEKRAWVCISMEFEKCRIYKRIIEALTLKPCKFQDECSIEDKVQSELRDKKFLIILDDLWNENTYEMSQFLVPFQFGAPNSKVVITTRNAGIANPMKTVGKSIELIGMSDEDCWSIFCLYARLDAASPLVAIGKELLTRFGGNPLASAIMGGILRGNHNEESWTSVLNGSSLMFEKGQDQIMSVVKMSYDLMPDCLKRFFLCCTMFPEDYELNKYLLADLWISSGLVSFGGKGKKSLREMESLAFSYIDELVSRSLLSERMYAHRLFCYYVMHDLVRDMGRKIPGNTYCRWEDKVESFDKTRYLTVHRSLIAEINDCLKEDPVHSLPLRIFLPIGGQMESVDDIDNFILRATKLRYLSLNGMGISKLPKHIGQMIHLRYLDISECKSLKELSPDIGLLLNLIDLDMNSCENLTTLPSEIGNLINLRCLNIAVCVSLITLPSEIGNLINLTELWMSCAIFTTLPSEIGNLSNLTDLIGQVCKNLTTLPPEIGSLRKLRSLEFDCDCLTTLPLEIGNLINLQHLNISHCKSLIALPPELGNLINLQHLNIGGCESLIALPPELGNLINLQHLNISGCKSLIALPPELGNLINLQYLYISGCESLTALPPEVGSFTKLPDLKFCGCKSLTALPSEIGNLVGLENLDLEGCESLTTLPSEIGNLVNLKTLNFSGCKSLTALPLDISNLINLTTLNFNCCQSLITLPLGIGSLINLTTLNFSGCQSLTTLP